MGTTGRDLKHTTKRELAEELERYRARARQVEERIGRIVDITSGIIYVLDRDGYFTFVNRAVEEILHFGSDELIGKHFSYIMEEDEFRRVGRKWVLPTLRGVVTGASNAPKIFDERRTGARRTRDMEVRLLTKEKRDERILVGDVAGIIGGEGSYDRSRMRDGEDMAAAFMGSQGIIFDITRYKKVEAEQRELLRSLLESQKIEAVERLAGGIAREFNNKIGVILGYAEMMHDKYGPASPEIDRYIDPVLHAGRRIADLTEKLLGFARHEGREMAAVDLNTIVGQVADLMENVADIRIEIRVARCEGSAMVIGDAMQIRNSLLNLAFNGLDAMKEGGRLAFGTEIVELDEETVRHHLPAGKAGTFVKVSVSDTGKGMSEEVRAKAFEPFFSTKLVGNELGLGLSGVHGCARHHNGFVVVKSTVDVGTGVGMFFPCLSAR